MRRITNNTFCSKQILRNLSNSFHLNDNCLKQQVKTHLALFREDPLGCHLTSTTITVEKAVSSQLHPENKSGFPITEANQR